MSYAPTIISTDDYGEIRIALGLAPDDDTSIPTSVIEARMFLREIEAKVTPVLSDPCTIVMDVDDDDFDEAVAERIKQVVILMTASLIAEKYFKARQGDRVKSHGIGPLSVSYDTGPDYVQLGQDLSAQALAVMSEVCADGAWALFNNPFAIVTEWPGTAATVEGVEI